VQSLLAGQLNKLSRAGVSRPYSTPEELLTKKAVGNSVYEKIKDLIIVY